jgi:hypothetical protein
MEAARLDALTFRSPAQRNGADGAPTSRRGTRWGGPAGPGTHATQEVVDFSGERRGSSVAEQLIRNEPVAPPTDTQHDVNPGTPTQQP